MDHTDPTVRLRLIPTRTAVRIAWMLGFLMLAAWPASWSWAQEPATSAAPPAPATAEPPGSPWGLLEGLRAGLRQDGPLTARFEQTYIPAGFSDGDREQGHLSLWLPTCLRWNYDEGKSFLVCDDEVHQWNLDEPSGRIYEIDASQETGLDLLLVDTATLRERYVASSDRRPDGQPVIALALPPGQGDFRATIVLDSAGTRVTELSYRDSEGNQTRFTIDSYQALAHNALFSPPADLEWIRE